MRVLEKYLIVRSDGGCRIVNRCPALAWDEVAVRLNIQIPDGWGQLAGMVDILLPKIKAPAVTVEEMGARADDD